MILSLTVQTNSHDGDPAKCGDRVVSYSPTFEEFERFAEESGWGKSERWAKIAWPMMQSAVKGTREYDYKCPTEFRQWLVSEIESGAIHIDNTQEIPE